MLQVRDDLFSVAEISFFLTLWEAECHDLDRLFKISLLCSGSFKLFKDQDSDVQITFISPIKITEMKVLIGKYLVSQAQGPAEPLSAGWAEAVILVNKRSQLPFFRILWISVACPFLDSWHSDHLKLFEVGWPCVWYLPIGFAKSTSRRYFSTQAEAVWTDLERKQICFNKYSEKNNAGLGNQNWAPVQNVSLASDVT